MSCHFCYPSPTQRMAIGIKRSDDRLKCAWIYSWMIRDDVNGEEKWGIRAIVNKKEGKQGEEEQKKDLAEQDKDTKTLRDKDTKTPKHKNAKSNKKSNKKGKTKKNGSSATGNRTRISVVTGRNTNHYTIADY